MPSNYGVRLAGVSFTNPALPVTRNYDVDIGQHPDVIGFYSPDADLVTQAADAGVQRVAAMMDRSATLRALSQATVGTRPQYVASGGPNDRPYLAFGQTRGDRLLYPAAWPVDASGGPYAKFTRLVLIRPGATPSSGENRVIYGSTGGVSGTGRHVVQLQGVNKILTRAGASGGAGSYTYDPTAWVLVMDTWDGSTGRATLGIDGAQAATATAAGSLVTDSTMALGFAANFDAASAIFVKADLSDQTIPSNVALLATAKQFYRDRYKKTVA